MMEVQLELNLIACNVGIFSSNTTKSKKKRQDMYSIATYMFQTNCVYYT